MKDGKLVSKLSVFEKESLSSKVCKKDNINLYGTDLLYTLSPSRHPDRNHSGLQGWHLLIS